MVRQGWAGMLRPWMEGCWAARAQCAAEAEAEAEAAEAEAVEAEQRQAEAATRRGVPVQLYLVRGARRSAEGRRAAAVEAAPRRPTGPTGPTGTNWTSLAWAARWAGVGGEAVRSCQESRRGPSAGRDCQQRRAERERYTRPSVRERDQPATTRPGPPQPR